MVSLLKSSHDQWENECISPSVRSMAPVQFPTRWNVLRNYPWLITCTLYTGQAGPKGRTTVETTKYHQLNKQPQSHDHEIPMDQPALRLAKNLLLESWHPFRYQQVQWNLDNSNCREPPEKFELWGMLSLCISHVASVVSPFHSSVFHFLAKLSKICEIFFSCEKKNKLVTQEFHCI